MMVQPLGTTNSWLVAANAARRPVDPSFALALAVAALALGLFCGPLVAAIILGLANPHVPLAIQRTVDYLCVIAPFLVVPFLSIRLYEHRHNPNGSAASFVLGLVVGSLAFLLALAIGVGLHAAVLVHVNATSRDLLGGVTVLLALAALQSFAEEYLFRGWLQPLLARRWSVWPAIVATAALFSAAHLVGGRIHISLAILNLFLAGVMFGLLALRSGGLAAPVAAHACWNWLERGVFGMTPNPGVDPLGSILDLDLVGPVLLSGGVDEFNGAIELTFVLGLVVLLLSVVPASGQARLRPPA